MQNSASSITLEFTNLKDSPWARPNKTSFGYEEKTFFFFSISHCVLSSSIYYVFYRKKTGSVERGFYTIPAISSMNIAKVTILVKEFGTSKVSNDHNSE